MSKWGALILMFMSTVVSGFEYIKPPLLKKGDTIAIVAPAKPADQCDLEMCITSLKKLGYHVKLASNLKKRVGYFAGNDNERAQAFMECWADPSVKAVWCIAGGYGCTRILNLLDWDLIRNNPKIFIGMSDVTALHAAIGKEAGLITFLGPNLGFIYEPKTYRQRSFAQKNVWQAITEQGNRKKVTYPSGFSPRIRTVKSGVATGRIVGGNLALVSSLCGTPWQIDTAGKVLVLEDVNEEPYRIDRMLCQLRNCGLLEKPAAVILCSFFNCKAKVPTFAFTLDEIFNAYFSQAKYPVLLGLPSGHIDDQATLPLNANVEVDATNHRVTILEPSLG